MKKLGAIIILLAISTLFLTTVTAQDETNFTLDNPLDKEIIIPENLQLIAKIFFGIKGDISISALIILLTIWVIVLLIVGNILRITPFFRSWTVWPAAIGVTILLALTGAFRGLTILLLDLATIFGLVGKLSAGALLLSVVVVVGLGIVLMKISKTIIKKSEIESRERTGEQVGVETEMSRARRRRT